MFLRVLMLGVLCALGMGCQTMQATSKGKSAEETSMNKQEGKMKMDHECGCKKDCKGKDCKCPCHHHKHGAKCKHEGECKMDHDHMKHDGMKGDHHEHKDTHEKHEDKH